MNHKLKVLVVEDEAAIRTGVTDLLVFHGYEVDAVGDGREGLTRAMTGKYDLVLLDVMMPGMNGFEVCDRIRRVDRDQPIILLTAKVSEEDIIQGLRLGADDYIAKPFSVTELVLRIEAVLRRSKPDTALASELDLGDLRVDAVNLRGEAESGQIIFTRREVEILQYLHAHCGRPVPREELLAEVWGYARHLNIETRTVDIHIAKLRRKIEPNPKQPRLLVTVRGAGYRLLPEG